MQRGDVAHGDKVSGFARQGVMFADPDQLQTAADFNNAALMMLADVLNDKRPTRLKQVLAQYNKAAQEAVNGQMDLFTGDVKSRQEILKDVINFLNNGNKRDIESAQRAAIEQRKASVQPNGPAEPNPEANGREPEPREGAGVEIQNNRNTEIQNIAEQPAEKAAPAEAEQAQPTVDLETYVRRNTPYVALVNAKERGFTEEQVLEASRKNYENWISELEADDPEKAEQVLANLYFDAASKISADRNTAYAEAQQKMALDMLSAKGYKPVEGVAKGDWVSLADDAVYKVDKISRDTVTLRNPSNNETVKTKLNNIARAIGIRNDAEAKPKQTAETSISTEDFKPQSQKARDYTAKIIKDLRRSGINVSLATQEEAQRVAADAELLCCKAR